MNVDNFVDISEILRIELNKAIVNQIKARPSTRIINLDELSFHDFKEYLQTTNVILWAQWIITSEDGVDHAAKWFENALAEFYVYISNRQTPLS